MYFKIFVNAILIIILSVVQIAFVSGLPSWFREINLGLIVLVLLLGFGSLKMSLWWAFGLGLILDIYLFVPFGTNIISLLIIVVSANFLLTNFLTNRSLYAFLFLTGFAIVSYEIYLFLIINFINIIFSHNLVYEINGQAFVFKIYGLVINLILVGIILYAMNHFGANFKPVFLRKRK